MNTEPRKCTKCQALKNISEFHRRGAAYQKICKTCRNDKQRENRAQQKQGKLPRPIKNNRENYSVIGQRIQLLEPRLRMIARQYSNDPHQAEDIFQHICEKLLAQADPSDSDSRILTTAKRRAGDFVNAERTYTFWVGDEGQVGGVDDDGESTQSFEYHVGDPRSAEDMLIEAEEVSAVMQAIEKLSPNNRQVATMLMSGMRQNEISRKLGVSEAAVSIRVSNIAKQLSAFGFSA